MTFHPNKIKKKHVEKKTKFSYMDFHLSLESR